MTKRRQRNWRVVDLNLLRASYRQLDGKKAVGIDGVTKASYGEKLEENLQDLLARLRRNAYKPRASRLAEIPKEDGSTRPLAISCFEEKIVQLAVELRQDLKESLHEETSTVLQRVKRKVKGWINYNAISDNQRRVSAFILLSKRALFSWINRKEGKRKMNWGYFGTLMKLINYPHNFKTISMFAAC